ncbi:hydantoinase B/oxoprolinase family protein [Leisingera sp. S232]|uniref:hydantoinase B/oxoprolinase family protein n=1 Tax=Leisingera sp. S232 TaxID=3415132 RepID=UPI003C79F771
MTVDPFTIEVIRHGLSAAAEEMSLTVMRAARSPVLREAGDLSSALTDHKGDLISQGKDIPAHIGTMSFTVKQFLNWIPKEQLRAGDVWFTNHPECGGNHLPDVKAIRPIFAKDKLVAFSISLAHWADVGGAWPGSYYTAATDSIQEGLRLPPLRLFHADGPDREKIAVVTSNVRGQHLTEGDIFAQMSATRSAEQRVLEICEEYGVDVFQQALEQLHDLSEAQMRQALLGLPDGVYKGEDFVDEGGPDDAPAAVRVTITVKGDTADFDFTETDDKINSVLNTTPLMAAAAMMYAIKAVAGPEIQPNGGCYRPLTFKTRPGSLIDPGPMVPIVGGNHETSQRVADAIFRALEGAVPTRLTAGGPTTAGLFIFGGVDAKGRYSTLYEVHGGGEGARTDRDGCPAVRVHMVNTSNTPVEVIEAEYPLRVLQHRLRKGSGGAGKHKGGDGIVREYLTLGDDMVLTTMFERRVVAPYGLCGGESGAPFRATLCRENEPDRELPGKSNMSLKKGDRLKMESSGGGGFGTK